MRLFQDCQIGPDFKVDFFVKIAHPEVRKDSYNFAEVLEPLRGFQTKTLVMYFLTGNEEILFVLDDLNGDTFKEFHVWHQSLEFLDLFDFQINKVDSETFFHFNKLTDLNLSHCGLQQISADAFTGLEMLKALDLSMNNLETFEDVTFDCLTNLEQLYLLRNNLEFIKPGLFQKCNKLQTLQLNSNPLSLDLDEDTFFGLESLTYFNLAATPLAETINAESPIIKKHMTNVVLELVDFRAILNTDNTFIYL